MQVRSAADLAWLFRGLSPHEFAGFVADLWSARGFETRVEGDAIIAERDGPPEDRHVLLVRHDRRRLGRFRIDWGSDREDATHVVTSGSGSRPARKLTHEYDAALVTAADLYQMTTYAIGDGPRNRLLRRYDRTPAPTLRGRRLHSMNIRDVVPDGDDGQDIRVIVLSLILVSAMGAVVIAHLPPDSPPNTRADTAVTPPSVTTTRGDAKKPRADPMSSIAPIKDPDLSLHIRYLANQSTQSTSSFVGSQFDPSLDESSGSTGQHSRTDCQPIDPGHVSHPSTSRPRPGDRRGAMSKPHDNTAGESCRVSPTSDVCDADVPCQNRHRAYVVHLRDVVSICVGTGTESSASESIPR